MYVFVLIVVVVFVFFAEKLWNIIKGTNVCLFMSTQRRGIVKNKLHKYCVMDERIICSIHPVSVEHNVPFVVDLSRLKDPNNVRADDLGTWRCTGSCILTVSVTCSCFPSKGGKVVNIRRQYHVHTTDGDLHRMIAFIENVQKGKYFY